MPSFLLQQDSVPAITNAAKLSSARRVVVKIGSALVADPETGEIQNLWLDTLTEDVSRLFARGQQVIIVASGAVAVGSRRFDRLNRPLLESEKQAAAAIGQVQLMHAYEQTLKRRGFSVGQLLLSGEDIANQHRRLNARSTLQQLLEVGAVPVVNENDATAMAGTCLGDNDRLAARVAQMVDADILILLSDVDGLFTDDPHTNRSARLVTEVRCICSEIEAMAAGSSARHSSGGMVTKLMAATIAMDGGCDMVIAKGNKPCPLAAIESGGPSTWFIPLAKNRANHDACADSLAQI